jgi:O-antigen ligase
VFAIPGICALIFFILCRPQEFIELLQKVPMLYVFAGAAVAGLVLDLKLRRLQPIAAPTLPWVGAFMLWALLCNAVEAGPAFMPLMIEAAILFVLYGTIAHGVQRFRSFQIVAGALMVSCLFITVVCFHQGFQDHYCVQVDELHAGEGTPDGRPCLPAAPEMCHGAGAEPGAEYRCEKVGWFGTYSIESRVRYRGEMHDPNELSLTICIGGLSFLLAFANRKRTATWIVYAAVGIVVILWTVLMSQSRGGLVVAMAVPGVYFIKRYGAAGVVGGAALAIPLLLLAGGGRDQASAAASTQLRYEAWAAGLEMFRESPLFGVGMRQFGEYHFMTAHNSFVLVLAELGFVGLVLFSTLLYLSVKGLWVGLRRLEHIPGAAVARVWGMALLASMLGLLFQINTLSFAYHSVLWVFLGLAAAWTGAVRHHLPDFEVKMTLKDVVLVIGACAIYAIVVLPIFLRWKGAM